MREHGKGNLLPPPVPSDGSRVRATFRTIPLAATAAAIPFKFVDLILMKGSLVICVRL